MREREAVLEGVSVRLEAEAAGLRREQEALARDRREVKVCGGGVGVLAWEGREAKVWGGEVGWAYWLGRGGDASEWVGRGGEMLSSTLVA